MYSGEAIHVHLSRLVVSKSMQLVQKLENLMCLLLLYVPIVAQIPHEFQMKESPNLTLAAPLLSVVSYKYITLVISSNLELVKQAKHLYTCQLSCIMCESHACGLKTSISRIKDNFPRLTHKSGQVVL